MFNLDKITQDDVEDCLACDECMYLFRVNDPFMAVGYDGILCMNCYEEIEMGE